MKFIPGTVGALVLAASSVNAIDLSPDDSNNVKQAASTIAYGMVKWYTGNRTGDVPGNLPEPYYWWETGAMFNALIDYWYYTGDSQYNDITTQAMLHQAGPNGDFMPANQTKTEGNDDQSFWAMAAMSAAENKFPDPPESEHQWLAIAQAVFNLQANRWEDSTCGGGLRWQIFAFNNGYNYKNTISNGCFFNMAARLAKYTKNDTYADWANRMWDWTASVELMSSDYHFFDGTDDTLNCTEVNHIQWTYNAGVYLLGAASMYNLTGEDKWKDRVTGIAKGLDVFFKNDIMYEVACETGNTCDVDQRSFKAYLARWMAATTKIAPFATDLLMPRLRTSAVAAAAQCSGGSDGKTCGIKWTEGANDGSVGGVGEQMSALEVVQSMLIDEVSGPVGNGTGGTSQGNPSAGSGGDTKVSLNEITTGDKVGAGFLTTAVLITILGGAFWVVS